MPRIQILDETLANQIAAGEVIERPAAVVKELVENALDAGAKRIEIDLLDGGKKLVRVRDDGSGMGREDARLSLQRHATSKLRTKDDLFAIASYGFRGEALPSIAAVSRFSLLTSEADALAGTRIEVDGGSLGPALDAGAPPGTTIEVRDLFWNVPARRKFIKRAATEQQHAIDAVLRLALPRLDVSFTLREGERTLLRMTAGETLASRAEEAISRELHGRWSPFDAAVRGVRAHGLAGSPDVAQGSAKGIWLFVNGRAIRDRQLSHAVLRAYGEVLEHGRFAAAVIFLEVPPAELDVNVHPAKAEVRLADARAAWEAIAAGLSAVLAPGAWLHHAGAAGAAAGGVAGVAATRAYALGAGGSAIVGVQSISSEGEPAADAERIARVGEAIARFGARTGANADRPWQPSSRATPVGGREIDGQPGAMVAQASAQPELLAAAPFFAGLRYLGQLHQSYLVCEGPRGLVLVDQHAAHERMNYQRLRAAAERTGFVQPLLVPRILTPAPSAAAALSASLAALGACGIELADFGAGTLAIKALPAELSPLADGQLLMLLADLAEELQSIGRGETLLRMRDALLARAACHASVRAHDALSSGEAQALLDALDATDYGARCAHGRPVVSEWAVAEIEKRFGRDYASHAHAARLESL